MINKKRYEQRLIDYENILDHIKSNAKEPVEDFLERGIEYFKNCISKEEQNEE